MAKSTKRWWKLEIEIVVYVMAVELPAGGRIENKYILHGKLCVAPVE
ncbi:hypothetical protein ACFL1V_09390 [Pseudomonadota bacterium]